MFQICKILVMLMLTLNVIACGGNTHKPMIDVEEFAPVIKETKINNTEPEILLEETKLEDPTLDIAEDIENPASDIEIKPETNNDSIFANTVSTLAPNKYSWLLNQSSNLIIQPVTQNSDINNCSGSITGNIDLGDNAYNETALTKKPCNLIGNLTIIGDLDENHKTLLSNIQIIEGNLSIIDTNLTDLNIFTNLTQVSGTLLVSDNTQLNSLTGLEHLSSVGNLTIQLNSSPQFKYLNALTTLTIIEHKLHIFSNPFLENIDGLNNLIKVGSPTDTDYLIQVLNNISLTINSNFFEDLKLNENQIYIESNKI